MNIKNNVTIQAICYNHLGDSLKGDSSLYYYQRAASSLLIQKNDTGEVSSTLSNIGIAYDYVGMGEIEKALQNDLNTTSLEKSINNYRIQSKAINLVVPFMPKKECLILLLNSIRRLKSWQSKRMISCNKQKYFLTGGKFIFSEVKNKKRLKVLRKHCKSLYFRKTIQL